MTPPLSASPLKDLSTAKAKFIDAAYAASPLRAVEKSPWVAVSATAAATLAATVITSGTLFGKVTGGLFTHGLGIASALLRSKLTAPFTAGPIPAPPAATSVG